MVEQLRPATKCQPMGRILESSSIVMHSCIPASDGWIDRMYIGSLPNENPVESGKASKQNAVTPKLTTCSKEPKLLISHVLPACYTITYRTSVVKCIADLLVTPDCCQ